MFKKKACFIAMNTLLYAIALPGYAMSTFASHPLMTQESAKYFMWKQPALEILTAAVVYPDREHNTTAYNKEYFPELHFDRYKTESNAEAFNKGLIAYRANLNVAIQMAKERDLIGAFTHLGGVLHAVQDFASHSNYIELDKQNQKIIDEILFENRSSEDVPKALKLTHYDPDEPIPGIPRGSDYAHNIKSKDYPFRGDVSQREFESGEIGYQKAFDTGVYFGRKVLTNFMQSVEEDIYRQMINTQLWNIFPLYAKNCRVGDVSKSKYETSMLDENIVCSGKPEYRYKLETFREVGINTFENSKNKDAK